MKKQVSPSWQVYLSQEFNKKYFKELEHFVDQERCDYNIFPNEENVFRAFDLCPFDKLKVVIIGQDPYHGLGQANGLCFSVNDGVKLPPSLKNIYKELKSDLDLDLTHSGNLDFWAEQGVLLLNATLTVREKVPGSHQKKGWEQFTDSIIKKINETKKNVVFLLWGAYAQKKCENIDEEVHLIIKSSHPSPFSVHKGFFGSKPFSKTNEYLTSTGQKPIDWAI